MLRAEIVEYFADDPHAFVFPHSRFHEAVKLVVSGIHHHARRVKQRDFVLRLDFPHLVHKLLAVDNFDSLSLQGK